MKNAHTNPADGGSYVRDPDTGALSMREPTTAPSPGKRRIDTSPKVLGAELASAPPEEAEPIPASLAGRGRRGAKPRNETDNTPPEE